MAKKKNVMKKHTNVITPSVNAEGGTLFDRLVAGECFLMSGNLYMKEEGCDQIAVNLATGKMEDCLCGTPIEPVNIAITWKKK